GRALLRDRLARRGVALSAGAVAAALVANAAEAATALLPPALLRPTVEAAVAGSLDGGAGSVVSLVEGGCRAMFRSKVKVAAAVLLLAGLVSGAGAVAHRALTATPAEAADEPKPTAKAEAPAEADPTPLPTGAAARLGSARFRHARVV